MKNTFLSCSHNESQMYGSWSNLMKKLNMMSLYGEKDFSSTLATSTFSILVSNWAYSSNIPEKEKNGTSSQDEVQVFALLPPFYCELKIVHF